MIKRNQLYGILGFLVYAKELSLRLSATLKVFIYVIADIAEKIQDLFMQQNLFSTSAKLEWIKKRNGNQNSFQPHKSNYVKAFCTKCGFGITKFTNGW